MLTCIARSKHPGDDSLNQPDGIDPNANPSTKQALKSLTYQAISPLSLSIYIYTYICMYNANLNYGLRRELHNS